ncbi:hypothetical protein SUGI_1111440 [Cryptomeria japonica]|nr:hypothetical protein SUGI_1111440 [Cryptomeria japonica]
MWTRWNNNDQFTCEREKESSAVLKWFSACIADISFGIRIGLGGVTGFRFCLGCLNWCLSHKNCSYPSACLCRVDLDSN